MNPDRRSFTVLEASDYLGIPIPTLNTWRSRNKGPPYEKHGSAVRYSRAALDSYIQERTVTPTG